MPKKPNKPILRILNCKESEDKENDWSFEDAANAGLAMAAAPAALPASIDLREDWWKIGDQLDTGSCVGWGTGEVIRWHMVKCFRMKPEEHLSIRYLWLEAKELEGRLCHCFAPAH